MDPLSTCFALAVTGLTGLCGFLGVKLFNSSATNADKDLTIANQANALAAKDAQLAKKNEDLKAITSNQRRLRPKLQGQGQ